MPIDTGFILAAGFGTRMGIIGKALPKVLWPVFDTTLLGMQIHFLKELGVSQIYINTHYQKELVIDYCRKYYSDIVVLVEGEILDAGGGVQNFLRESEVRNSFIVLNSDQFFATDLEKLKAQIEVPVKSRAKIFTMKGNADYSSIESDEESKMLGITKDSEGEMFIGLSIINPHGLKRVVGKSKFFESVCNYKNEDIEVERLEGEFLDFGEVKKYQRSCFKLFNYLLNQNETLECWNKAKMIDKSKMMNASYHSDLESVLNFSNHKLSYQYPKGSIILKEPSEDISVLDSSIIYESTIEEIK